MHNPLNRGWEAMLAIAFNLAIVVYTGVIVLSSLPALFA